MNIYILFLDYDYDGMEHVGAYSTLTLAEQAGHEMHEVYRSRIVIQKHTINPTMEKRWK